MEKTMETFLNDYWPYIAGALVFVLSVLNQITDHHSQGMGWGKIALLLLERLSVLTSKDVTNGGAGIFKLPGTDVRPDEKKPGQLTLLPLFLALSMTACTTMDGQTKWNPSKTMAITCSITPAAISIWRATCEAMDGKKKAKCLKTLDKAAAAANVILGAGQAALGACQLGNGD
jgi:hypothetical protein